MVEFSRLYGPCLSLSLCLAGVSLLGAEGSLGVYL